MAFNLTDRRFGFLRVIGLSVIRMYGQLAWVCECECGNKAIVPSRDLRRGHTKSCGCKKGEMVSKAIKRHGAWAGQPTGSNVMSEWRIWSTMRQRCTNPKSSSFKYYGAKGIKVCEEWSESFEKFLEDMGPKPTGNHSIDRIDPKGNYEPGNCRWATRTEQSRNKSSTLRLTVAGVTKTLKEWADETGLDYQTIRMRVRVGMSPEVCVGPYLGSSKFKPKKGR